MKDIKVCNSSIHNQVKLNQTKLPNQMGSAEEFYVNCLLFLPSIVGADKLTYLEALGPILIA